MAIIERVSLRQLEAFYGPVYDGRTASVDRDFEVEPSGSNGFAIAPSNSASGNALLLINPHTSFFFRAELHMVSEEGLNAYGAVTWGQFFVYQGFNEGSGWMRTSSGVDNINEYFETVIERDGRYFYRYGGEDRPVTEREIAIPYKTDTGTAERRFTVYRTHHGPVVKQEDDKWVSVSLMEAPMDALTARREALEAAGQQFYPGSPGGIKLDYFNQSESLTDWAEREQEVRTPVRFEDRLCGCRVGFNSSGDPVLIDPECGPMRR